MSRKDYIAIAAAIHKAWMDGPPDMQIVRFDTAREIAAAYAKLAKRDNPDFDRARFLTACGVEG